MASISSSSAPKYPYPSEVNIVDFVFIKLSQTNYVMWSKLMLDHIKKKGLIGFIDGTLQPPSDAPDHENWKRSDSVVKGWILSTVEDDIVKHVTYIKTAEKIWSMLKKTFGYPFADLPENELNNEAGKNLGRYLPLHKAALSGDWEKAEKFIKQEPQAFRAIITGDSDTALTVAIRSVKRNYFVKKLIELMSPEDLAIEDRLGITALHIAAATGNVESAKLLVDKNPYLPHKISKTNELPLHLAASYGHRNMVDYLLTVTKEDGDLKPFEDKLGVELILALLFGGFYVMQKLHPGLWTFFENLGIKTMSEASLMHHEAIELVRFLCLEVLKLDCGKAIASIGLPLRLATQLGNREVVEEILAIFPGAMFLKSEKNESLFHLAILYRQANVYNLVYQFEDFIHTILVMPDVLMNNALHFAACVENKQRLKLRATAPGAALQMQRELQWFKEVERFMLPRDRQQHPNTEGKTPGMVFTETHAELIKEAEQRMKDKANSCAFVAALIAAVVFAAAITVPSGNNYKNNGLPHFSVQTAFRIFAISDALSLFCSMSSIIMFLSILTSRYAVDDFLYVLPNRLIIGLGTLFLAIVSMIVAFCASFYIVFGNKKEWIPLISVACLSIVLLASLQFRLLLIMIKSTYFPRLFGRQSHRVIF